MKIKIKLTASQLHPKQNESYAVIKNAYQGLANFFPAMHLFN